jgi:hypothetical protein
MEHSATYSNVRPEKALGYFKPLYRNLPVANGDTISNLTHNFLRETAT